MARMNADDDGYHGYPRSSAKSAVSSQKVLDDHLVEGLVIAVGDQLAGAGFVEGLGFLHQTQKGAAAVGEMIEPMFDFGGAEGMDIEADVFAVAAVFVALEGADLVEGAAE